MSWNVEHFHGDPERIEHVASFLKIQEPDLFALYEVTGSEVFSQMVEQFPGYTFQITEGPQTQEILVGVRNTFTAFITQNVQFKAGATYMRPGQLVTITKDGVNYSLLFLHLASGTNPRGMGLRDEMLHKAVKFRHILDKAYGDRYTANYMFLGDLNTMGMEYPFDRDIVSETELRKWDTWASRYYGMKRLEKSFDKTWNGSSSSSLEPSDLDHVYTAKHLKFKQFRFKKNANRNADVDVRGWVDEQTDQSQDKWIDEHSDHSLLYFEIQKVV